MSPFCFSFFFRVVVMSLGAVGLFNLIFDLF